MSQQALSLQDVSDGFELVLQTGSHKYSTTVTSSVLENLKPTTRNILKHYIEYNLVPRQDAFETKQVDDNTMELLFAVTMGEFKDNVCFQLTAEKMTSDEQIKYLCQKIESMEKKMISTDESIQWLLRVTSHIETLVLRL